MAILIVAAFPSRLSRYTHAIRAGKRLLNLAVDGDQHGILLEEAREQVALIGSPNQMEAVMANLEKRQPKFAEVATGGPAP